MQIRQIPNDFFRIAFGTAATTFLPRALAEELLFRNQRDVRSIKHQSGGDLRHSDAERRVACAKRAPGVDERGIDVPLAQNVEQQLAPSRGFGGDQHASLEIRDECAQFARRLFAAHIDADMRRRLGCEVLKRHRLRERIEFDARQIDAAESRMTLPQFLDRHEDFGRRKNGPRRIVTALVIARLDVGERMGGEGLDIEIRRDRRIRRQIIEQRRALVEEQR
jgi:hypothetical protein